MIPSGSKIKYLVSPGLSTWAVVSPSRWDENQKQITDNFETTVTVAALKVTIITIQVLILLAGHFAVFVFGPKDRLCEAQGDRKEPWDISDSPFFPGFPTVTLGFT